MTIDELKAEIRAINDLEQQLSERNANFHRRLYRHFDAEPGSGKTDYWSVPRKSRWIPIGRRDDDDEGGD